MRFDPTTRLFSDIGGIFLRDLNNEIAARQRSIARLRACGLELDDNTGTDWPSKRAGGDFTPAA